MNRIWIPINSPSCVWFLALSMEFTPSLRSCVCAKRNTDLFIKLICFLRLKDTILQNDKKYRKIKESKLAPRILLAADSWLRSANAFALRELVIQIEDQSFVQLNYLKTVDPMSSLSAWEAMKYLNETHLVNDTSSHLYLKCGEKIVSQLSSLYHYIEDWLGNSGKQGKVITNRICLRRHLS